MKILKLEIEVEQDGKLYQATGDIDRVKGGEYYFEIEGYYGESVICWKESFLTEGVHIIMEEIPGGTG